MLEEINEQRVIDPSMNRMNYRSVFNALNLDAALALVRTPPTVQSSIPDFSSRPNKKMFGRHLPGVRGSVATELAFCPALVYPQLFPVCGPVIDKRDNLKTFFLPSELNLLALGLVQFQRLPKYAELIQQHLMPSKKPESIHKRILNLTHERTADNPVKVGLINEGRKEGRSE